MSTAALSLDLIDRNGEPVQCPLPKARTTTIYFMRSADCLACRIHLDELICEVDELRRIGSEIVVVIPEGIDKAGELFDAVCAPFPVATSFVSFAAVGLQKKFFGRILQSGTILLDNEGRVIYARRATLAALSLPMSGLKKVIAAS